MTKTKLQKQKAKSARKGPQQSVGLKAAKKKRKRQRRKIGPSNIIGPRNMRMSERVQREILGTSGNLGMNAISDGISRQMGIVNNSNIEDRFQVRFEKVSDVFGTTAGFALATSQASGAGQNIQYFLNPGNTLLFPIFSKTATTYEQYRVNRLRFHWVSEAYTASGTAVSAGRVLMTTNFDPDASNFVNKNQMENYERTCAFAPFSPHVVHDVMEARGRRMQDTATNLFYVSGSANQATPVSGQAKFYDVGNFQMATSGVASATAELGELWVEYSFTMIRPLQENPLGDSLSVAHYQTTPVTTVSRFGSAVQQTGSNLAVTFSANAWTLPYAGNFLVVSNFTAGTSHTDVGT